MEVLAASVGFELYAGNRVAFDGGNWNDPTGGITRFAKWRNQMDDNKDYYKVAIVMFELAYTPRCVLLGFILGGMRATPEDPI